MSFIAKHFCRQHLYMFHSYLNNFVEETFTKSMMQGKIENNLLNSAYCPP